MVDKDIENLKSAASKHLDAADLFNNAGDLASADIEINLAEMCIHRIRILKAVRGSYFSSK